MTEKKYNLKKSKTIRLSDSTVKNINYLVNETKISESELLRSIIEKAIAEYRLKKAFEEIKKNKTISHAARIAGLSYREFFDKIIDHKILSESEINQKINYDKEDVEEILKAISN
jgi:predicted DNA-binding protein